MKYSTRIFSFGIFLSAAICSVSSPQVNGDELYDAITRGDLNKATTMLSERITAANRDGNTLFYQSLLEQDADRSAKLMEAALRSGVDFEYQELIFYRLAQFYHMSGQSTRLSEHLANYRARWENGVFQLEMRRFSILADEKHGAHESAIGQCDRYLLRSSHNEDIQWGKIDKARVMRAFKKQIAANQFLKELSHEREGEGVPIALYLLADDAIRRGKTDDALFYYSMLREGYRASVGLEALVTRMGDLEAGGSSAEAERMTGTFYSVQVGVFSDRDNAKNMAKKFKAYDHKVEVKDKVVSDKKYNVVYIGRFDTYEAARSFQGEVELAFGEVYQVVAR